MLWNLNNAYTQVSIYTTIAVGTNAIYFTSGSIVSALSISNGEVLWNYTNVGYNFGDCPAIGTDGTVYIGSEDYKIYALDGTTGNLKWSYTTGSSASSPVTVDSNNVLIALSADGNVYILDGNTGTTKEKYETKGFSWENSYTVLGIDGTVYMFDFPLSAYGGTFSFLIIMSASGAEHLCVINFMNLVLAFLFLQMI